MSLHKHIFVHIADMMDTIHRHLVLSSVIVPGLVQRIDDLRDMAHEADLAFESALEKLKAQMEASVANAAQKAVEDAIAAEEPMPSKSDKTSDAKSVKGKD